MIESMSALRWHGRGDLRVDEVCKPKPGVGEVLLAVEMAGLCGTDLEEYAHGPVTIPTAGPHPLSGRAAPITLGHEVVGRVCESPTDETLEGKRVIPDVVLGCDHCWWCRRHLPGHCSIGAVRGLHADGGLANYMLAEAATAVPVPESLSPEVAVFAEPVAVAVRGLRKVGDLTGATVAVIGAGTIGLLVAALTTGRDAERVVAVDPLLPRRRIAEQFGATPVPPNDAERVIAEMTGGRGADVVLECSGAVSAVPAALRLGRAAATIVLIGTPAGTIPLDVRDLVIREQRVLGSAAHVWDEEVTAAVASLARNLVDPHPLITDVVPLADAVSAGFHRLHRDPDAVKILIQPDPRETSGRT